MKPFPIEVFHYTLQVAYERMQSEQSGILPLRQIGKLSTRHYFTDPKGRAVFAHLEPKPKNWMQNEEFPNSWKRFVDYLTGCSDRSDSPIVLLKFSLNATDEAYVVDRGIIEKHFDNGDPGVHSKSIEDYLKSKIPVDKYNETHSLPEVVIGHLIGHERLNLVQTVSKEELLETIAYRQVL